MHKRLWLRIPILVCLIACSSTAPPASGPAASTTNPLLTKSPLPFQAPPFDKINDGDYEPAIEEGMRQQLAEIEAIADNPAPADLRQHDRGDGALGRAADARVTRCSSNVDAGQHQRHAAEDPGGPRAEARRAQRRDLPQPEAVRARQGDLRPARHARARRRGQVPRRALHLHLRARRRAALRRRQGTAHELNEEESKLTTEFADKLLADDQCRGRRRRRQGRARRPERRATSPRRPRRRRSASSTASGCCRCRTRRSSRRWRRSTNRALRAARCSRPRTRAATTADANDTRAIIARLAAAARREGEAARLPDLRGLRPRRPDGEDAGERDQAA